MTLGTVNSPGRASRSTLRPVRRMGYSIQRATRRQTYERCLASGSILLLRLNALWMVSMAHQSPQPPKNSMALSPARWKKAVSLGLQLADENKRVSRRLASLRKAEKKQLKTKTRKVSDAETNHAHID